MFVVEKFFADFDSREEAYEKRMAKWIEDGKISGYNYRSEVGYRRDFGASPKTKAYTIAKHVLIVVFSAFMVFAMAQLITVEVQEDNKSSQEVKNDTYRTR